MNNYFLQNEDPIFPQNIDTEVPGARMDPKHCPNNPDLIAFVHSNDLWVVNTKSRHEVRLTVSNNGAYNLCFFIKKL